MITFIKKYLQICQDLSIPKSNTKSNKEMCKWIFTSNHGDQLSTYYLLTLEKKTEPPVESLSHAKLDCFNPRGGDRNVAEMAKYSKILSLPPKQHEAHKAGLSANAVGKQQNRFG